MKKHSYPYHFFSVHYDIGLASQICELPPNSGACTDFDRNFYFFATSAVGLSDLLDSCQLEFMHNEIKNGWMSFFHSLVQGDTHRSEQAQKKRK